MSLSVSGYPHQGYPHPGPMSHEFYQYPQYRYADHCAEATYFQNWVLNGVGINGHHPDITVSPESYGMCTPSPTDYHGVGGDPYAQNFERCLKRRTTANKKERRRTQSINTAFAQLRGCIPNVPSDTKLSKIKTLRLATSYIAYLMDVLAKDDPTLTEKGFKAELTKKKDDRKEKEKEKLKEQVQQENSHSSGNEQSPTQICDKKSKGRTGWPQHVWASELKS
ncbi:hypothetical protein FSP39_013916 [Pinctada imbricata]|uniref:BHLH domain-containing protein n=1 Tax=Pinctada imbricata TaxID=66713 RepID=A0AA88Y8I2_PINIB|nr:hypothetical protein FSP39_013916 [Pinctada imbricata]